MPKPKRSIFEKIATFIVDKRTLFFLLYLFAFIFCIISSGWVTVENDVTTYLSEDTEIRQGLEAMNGNFVTPGTARIMVSNITLDTAWELNEAIASTEGVVMSAFDGTENTYKDTSALYEVTFLHGPLEQKAIDSMDTIRSHLEGYDFWVDTTVGYDENVVNPRSIKLDGTERVT